MGLVEFLHRFALAFVPIFVAVDVFGIFPIFVSLTENLDDRSRKRIILQSFVTALAIAMGFIFLGKIVFALLHVTPNDFMVAGGALLFIIAISHLLTEEKFAKVQTDSLGAVPLGTPLITGPAVLTTILILEGRYGLLATLAATVTNIFIAGLVLSVTGFLMRVLGKAGARAASKVASILLASIAVMMIRSGLLGMVDQFARK